MVSIPVPDGWTAVALFGRLVTDGVCSYACLSSPSTSARDVFMMLRMLDFRDYRELKAMEREERRHADR